MSLKFSKLGARQTESNIARLMTLAIERPELLSLAAGFTDTNTLPLESLSEIAEQVGKAGDRTVLQYGANQGLGELRRRLTDRLAEQDGLKEPLPLDQSLITNGSQQSLYLAIQSLCDEGDIVLVEQPTYFVFLEMLRGLGVQAISMPMDGHGDVDVEGLGDLLERLERSGSIDRVKAVYLVSYYANPSGHSVSRSCKEALMQRLAQYEGRIALLEDAAYRELYFEKPFESPSCLALQDGSNPVPVFYTTTLTKPFATGLKVGYAYCSHKGWLARMLAIKGQQDFGTANYNQVLMEKALAMGVFDRHLATLRIAYHSKMETLHAAISDRMKPLGWRWQKPEGGLYLWLTAPEGVETGFDSPFYQAAVEQGVLYVPGELCHAEERPKNRVRLSFGVLAESELRKAGERFALAADCFCAS